MRTTIELDDNLRGQLLELAAKRGLKGFSQLIEEAVVAWLQSQSGQDGVRRKAAALQGTLSGAEADDLQRGAGAARTSMAQRTWE